MLISCLLEWNQSFTYTKSSLTILIMHIINRSISELFANKSLDMLMQQVFATVFKRNFYLTHIHYNCLMKVLRASRVIWFILE